MERWHEALVFGRRARPKDGYSMRPAVSGSQFQSTALASESLNEEGEKAWLRLLAELDGKTGFWLGFVFSPSLRSVAILRERVRQKLAAESRPMVVARPERPDALPAVFAALLGQPEWVRASCIWVESVSTDPPGAPQKVWQGARDTFFVHLNDRRDALASRLRGGLVFAAPPALAERITTTAPGLWAMRSLDLSISADPAARAAVAPRAVPVLRPVAPGQVPPPPRKLDTQGSVMASAASFAALRATMEDAAPDPDSKVAEAQRAAALQRIEVPPSHPAQADVQRAGQAAARDEGEEAEAPNVPLGTALLQAAEGYLTKGDPARAKSTVELAAKRLRNADLIGETQALFVLAESEEALGEHEAACRHIMQAIFRRNKSAPDKVPTAWYDRAGTMAFEKGDVTLAKTYFEGAVTRARALVGSGPADLATAPLKRELSSYLKHLGDARIAAAETQAAAEAFEEALDLDRSIASVAELSEAELEEALQELSVSLTRVGDLRHAAGDSFAGFAAYEESLAIHRSLSEHKSSDPMHVRNLSIALNRMGRAWFDAGDPSKAVPCFEESVRLRKQICVQFGATPERMSEVASSLSKLGWALLSSGQAAEAVRVFEELSALAKHEISKSFPEASQGYLFEGLQGMASGYEALGDEPKARAAAAMANALNPG